MFETVDQPERKRWSPRNAFGMNETIMTIVGAHNIFANWPNKTAIVFNGVNVGGSGLHTRSLELPPVQMFNSCMHVGSSHSPKKKAIITVGTDCMELLFGQILRARINSQFQPFCWSVDVCVIWLNDKRAPPPQQIQGSEHLNAIHFNKTTTMRSLHRVFQYLFYMVIKTKRCCCYCMWCGTFPRAWRQRPVLKVSRISSVGVYQYFYSQYSLHHRLSGTVSLVKSTQNQCVTWTC